MTNTSNPYAGYSAKVFYRNSDRQGVFSKKSGWVYQVFFKGECVSAGTIHSEDAARREAKQAIRWHFQQNGGAR